MNDIFTDQKEKLVSILNEINLLRQQVSYLLRNEKALGLLDLDVLMNRTHTIYDQLCAIDLGSQDENEDFDLDAEALAGLFGIAEESEPEPEAIEPGLPRFARNDDVEPIEEEPIEPIEMEPKPEEPVAIEPGLPRFARNDKPEPEEPLAIKPVESEVIKPVEPEVAEPIEPVAVEPGLPRFARNDEPEPEPEKPLGDEYGFFFRFEDIPAETPTDPEAIEPVEMALEPEEPKAIEPVEMEPELPVDTPVVMDDKIVHFVEEIPEDEIPERDRVVADELLKDNTFEMPQMEDSGFEMAVPETLGESMMQEDLTLAAKLQQNPVRDLKSVIGINDKFLFVNELFGGSMEKYNKSVENLNDLKTLNGAMIYLNELKIELQWNSSNEAYQKLTELVKRKFE